jgi:predicted transcriptional regulator
MKKISQKDLADYLKVSQQLICDVKKKRRKFGKKSAGRISTLTSVSFEDLIFLNGEELIKKLYIAYYMNNDEL